MNSRLSPDLTGRQWREWLRRPVVARASTPRQQQRFVARLMLGLTLCYLLVEMGFNARLLDVVGGLASPAQVESIEVYGRLIAGTAVALLGLGWVLKKACSQYWSLGRTLAWSALTVGSCLLVVFYAQLALINHLVATSTPQERARAVLGVPISYLLVHREFGLKGLELGTDDYKRPEGKTLLATLPILLQSVDRLEERVRQQGLAFFELFAETRRGPLADNYQRYREALAELDELYGNYRQGSQRYLDATSPAAIARHQQQVWDDYVQTLKQRNRRLTPGNVPRRHWPQVRRMLDDKGIQVSDNWQPGDRAGFNLAVAKRVQGHASGAYGTELFKHIQGDWIKPGLSRQGFFADPAIQQRWRSALYLPDSLSLKPDWSLDAYEQAIYRPTLRLDAQQLLEERLVEPARYGERNDKADIGRDSYRALIVPMIALLFSLLGAFTHLFKCTLFALRAVRPVPRRAYWGALAVYAVVVLALPMPFSNKVTEQPLFLTLKQRGASTLGAMGWVIAHGAQWTAQVQPLFYPLNEAIRLHLLQGLSYGYHDND